MPNAVITLSVSNAHNSSLPAAICLALKEEPPFLGAGPQWWLYRVCSTRSPRGVHWEKKKQGGGWLLAGFAQDRVCGTQEALRAKQQAAFFPFFSL